MAGLQRENKGHNPHAKGQSLRGQKPDGGIATGRTDGRRWYNIRLRGQKPDGGISMA